MGVIAFATWKGKFQGKISQVDRIFYPNNADLRRVLTEGNAGKAQNLFIISLDILRLGKVLELAQLPSLYDLKTDHTSLLSSKTG